MRPVDGPVLRINSQRRQEYQECQDDVFLLMHVRFCFSLRLGVLCVSAVKIRTTFSKPTRRRKRRVGAETHLISAFPLTESQIKTRSCSFAMQLRRKEKIQIRKQLCAGVRMRLILTWLSHEIGL